MKHGKGRRLARAGAALVACALLSAPATGDDADGASALLPLGTYRLEMWQVSSSRLFLMGRTHTTFVSRSLAEVTSTDGGLWQSHRVCSVRFETGFPMVEMAMPDAFLESLWTPSYRVKVERDGKGWRYEADFGIEHVGYVPSAPDGPLPKKTDDPSIVDSDGDGHPGATLHLVVPVFEPLELYVVQRGHQILRGHVVEPGRVEGGIETEHFEQRVIGASPYFLKRSPKMKPDSKRSRFALTRAAEDTTCETFDLPLVETVNAE